jgi:hypothetical protein
VLLILEGGDAQRTRRAEEAESAEVVERGLPHLTRVEREEALCRYLGHTTWRTIVDEFDLDPEVLTRRP